jgi:hypothetical protein
MLNIVIGWIDSIFNEYIAVGNNECRYMPRQIECERARDIMHTFSSMTNRLHSIVKESMFIDEFYQS